MENDAQEALPLVSVKQQEQIERFKRQIEEEVRKATQNFVGRKAGPMKVTVSLGVAHCLEVEFTVDIEGEEDNETRNEAPSASSEGEHRD